MYVSTVVFRPEFVYPFLSSSFLETHAHWLLLPEAGDQLYSVTYSQSIILAQLDTQFTCKEKAPDK